MIVYTVEWRYARSDSLISLSLFPCCCLAYCAASLFLMLNSITASQQGYMNLQSWLVSGSQQYSVGSMQRKSSSGHTILPLQGSCPHKSCDSSSPAGQSSGHHSCTLW